ncbi:(2Fe-2S)-binding protein [Actinocorallia populi]|uniref:(2Fe-2S)-binding protein n=1 Tax=Actinocorallia populi TaxID=2079200 RepID=UPI0013006867|nr:(2Fe-2S)-binding protein [Actinocorallia populi]
MPLGLREVIDDVSAVGGFFHLSSGPGDASWRPLAELFTDRAALEERLARTLGLLEIDEPRVAASLIQMGFASRLWSPVVGAAVLHGRVLEWTPDSLRGQAVPTGPLPLRLPSPKVRPAGDDPAAVIHRDVTALLESLAVPLQRLVKIPTRLLWDNAASALAGTTLVLALQRPEHAADAIALARRILALPPFEAAHRLTEPVPGRPSFTRAACCLYYRVPGSGKCGDCALRS